jgi:very-short-patch-repair endonuclease
MRRAPTLSESMVWADLRRSRLGHKFRRRQPIGPFIVNFVCLAKRLIIELDGFTHGLEQSYNYDRYRHRWLESNGFRVLRYTDDDVREDRGAVIDSIATVLEQMDG